MSNTENSKPTISNDFEINIQKCKDDIKKINRTITIFTILALVAAVLGLVSAVLPLFADKIMGMGLNDYGDYTGGVVASLWSLAGLFMVYVAFLGQRIGYLEQEIALLDTQKKMEAQNYTQLLQRFENTLFQMQVAREAKIGNVFLGEKKGYDAFYEFYYQCKNLLVSVGLWETTGHYKWRKREIWSAATKKWFEALDVKLKNHTNYYSTTYYVLKFIDKSHIDFNEKMFYADWFRSTISHHEAVVLFNYIQWQEDIAFKKLVEKYHFFAYFPNLGFRETKEARFYTGFYDESAFEETPNNEGDQPSA